MFSYIKSKNEVYDIHVASIFFICIPRLFTVISMPWEFDRELIRNLAFSIKHEIVDNPRSSTYIRPQDNKFYQIN